MTSAIQLPAIAPCPICGGEPDIDECGPLPRGAPHLGWYAACYRMTPEEHFVGVNADTRLEAVRLWNDQAANTGGTNKRRISMEWRAMDSFIPPKPRAFNSHQDHRQWYWVTWGEDAYLCRHNGTHFVPVAGGMILGAHPKFWMPLQVPVAPLINA